MVQRKICFSHQCSYIRKDGSQCTRRTYADVCNQHRNSKKLSPCKAGCGNYTQSKSGYCPCSLKLMKQASDELRYIERSNYIMGKVMVNILESH